MTAPKRFDAAALLRAPGGHGAETPRQTVRRYERVSAYLRPDQREWLEKVATAGLRNSSVSDVLRLAVDLLRQQVGRDLDLDGAVIAAAQRDVDDGFAGRARIGIPRRR